MKLIYEVCRFIDENAVEVPFDKCTIVLGILGDCILAFPVVKDKFVNYDVKIGQKFFYNKEKIVGVAS